MNVVFMDNDIFVFKSLTRIFENEDFDYGCTISDSKAMPVRLPPLFGSDPGMTPTVSRADAPSIRSQFCGQLLIASYVRLLHCLSGPHAVPGRPCAGNIRSFDIRHPGSTGPLPVRRSTSACSLSRLGAMLKPSISWTR